MHIERFGKRTWLKCLLGFVISAPTACWMNTQLAVSYRPETDTGGFIPLDTARRLLDSEFLDAQQIFPDFVPDNLPVQIPIPDQRVVRA